LQNLTHRFAADRGLDGILNVGDIDSVARGLLAVNGNVQVGLSQDSKQAEILNTGDPAHDIDNLFALSFEDSQIITIQLDGKLAFYTADRFFHVVGDRLRKISQGSRHLAEFAVHCRNELVLVLVKHWSPLALWFEVNEVLGVEEAGESVPSSGLPTWLVVSVTSGNEARIERA
jgi:hypothetical protein